MNTKEKIYLAGHDGLVGSAILRSLRVKGYNNIVHRKFSEMDLRSQAEVNSFFESEKPDNVIIAAAKVGGIYANNKYRAEFIYDNLMIQNNIIHAAYKNDVKKLLFLGSTCIYPKESPQPMKEDYLLTSPLEYTNEPYAIAKIAGIKMCESYNLQYGTNFLSVMPTNLYGPGDNFNLMNSHVLPAILRKMHLARLLKENNNTGLLQDLSDYDMDTIGEADPEKVLSKFGIYREKNDVIVEIWGTGKPMRELLHVDDMADACTYIMEKVDFNDILKKRGLEGEIRNTHINIGTGSEISIAELANLVKKVVGFDGSIRFNPDKPDGTLRKLTDTTQINNLGWKHKTPLEDGIRTMYNWYQSNQTIP